MNQPLAVQLYSVREQAKENFPAILKIIADIGYCGVEFAGFHGYDIKELSRCLQDLGLKAISNHVEMPTKETITQQSDEAGILGFNTLISGLRPEDMTINLFDSSIEKFNLAATLAKMQGLRFCMHNHWWEFDNLIDGKPAFDNIMSRTLDMFSELDMYWANIAGAVPSQVLSKWQDRIPLLHIKDGFFTDRISHVAVGQGKMNFRTILTTDLCKKVEWFIVEIDNCETDVVEAIRQSYRFLVDNHLGVGTK